MSECVSAQFLFIIENIAHWADEFSTDAFGEMHAIICW